MGEEDRQVNADPTAPVQQQRVTARRVRLPTFARMSSECCSVRSVDGRLAGQDFPEKELVRGRARRLSLAPFLRESIAFTTSSASVDWNWV